MRLKWRDGRRERAWVCDNGDSNFSFGPPCTRYVAGISRSHCKWILWCPLFPFFLFPFDIFCSIIQPFWWHWVCRGKGSFGHTGASLPAPGRKVWPVRGIYNTLDFQFSFQFVVIRSGKLSVSPGFGDRKEWKFLRSMYFCHLSANVLKNYSVCIFGNINTNESFCGIMMIAMTKQCFFFLRNQGCCSCIRVITLMTLISLRQLQDFF